ncbi:MAG: hypothetical protein RSB51_04445 [Clostridia bacterium]
MKKGMSLLALVATIIVIGIVTSTVVITGGDAINNTKKMQFADEINTLQIKVKDAEMAGILEECTDPKLEIDYQNAVQGFIDSLMYEDKNLEGKYEVYPINLAKLGVGKMKHGVKEAGEDDVFVYSPNTQKVYYMKGTKISGAKYYTLTKDLDVKNQYDAENYFPAMASAPAEELTKGATLYNPNQEYAASASYMAYVVATDPVKSIEIIETNAEINTVTKLNSSTIYQIKLNIIPQNVVKLKITTETNQIINSKITMAKLDRIAPKIDANKIKPIYFEAANGLDVRMYLEDDAVTDAGDAGSAPSGIKEIRYADGIHSREEMRKIGAILEGTSFEIKYAKEYTIYAVDNAGGESIKTIYLSDEIKNKILESK